jgi:diguanylate cyclase (GGDEF)-like protein
MSITTPFEDVFVATLRSTSRQQRFALVTIVISFLIFSSLAPFAKVQLPAAPLFIAVYQTAFVLNDAITAFLLFGQYRILQTRALCVLGCGYLFTALIAAIHALSFPGLLAPSGLFDAGPQTTAWLYMFWHGGFPLFVIAYACLKDGGDKPRGTRGTVAAGVAGTAVLTGAVTLFATVGQQALPEIMQGNRYTPLMLGVVTSVWLLSVAALYVLWRREQRSVLDLWLMVAMCAWMIDIALSAVLNGGRFDLGFYAGRLYGLLAASFLLLLLLHEHGALYAQLVARSMELRRLMSLDPLTGIANRRSFDETLNLEWRRAIRSRQPLALLVIDVDHFKLYNDTYGHVAGDECLRTVADVIDTCIQRAGDLAARYGGEEFAVILPDTTTDDACMLAQKICNTLQQRNLPHRGSPSGSRVTVSIGVAGRYLTLPAGSTPDAKTSNPVGLIEAADKALYDAKAAGRNRIACEAPAAFQRHAVSS